MQLILLKCGVVSSIGQTLDLKVRTETLSSTFMAQGMLKSSSFITEKDAIHLSATKYFDHFDQFCGTLGAINKLSCEKSAEFKHDFKMKEGAEKTCKRIFLKESKTVIWSEEYTRSKLHRNHFVLVDNDVNGALIGSVVQFLIVGNQMLAVCRLYNIDTERQRDYKLGDHICVVKESKKVLIDVHRFKEKLVYMVVYDKIYVARSPNLYGRSVIL